MWKIKHLCIQISPESYPHFGLDRKDISICEESNFLEDFFFFFFLIKQGCTLFENHTRRKRLRKDQRAGREEQNGEAAVEH